MADEAVLPGRTFAGRYQVERLLGEGDRKRTYLAHDLMLERDVALAVAKPEAVRSDAAVTHREAMRIGQVGGHHSIVQLYDRGTADGTDYLVFEYLPNGTLRERCRGLWAAHGGLPFDDILLYGRQLTRALMHLHSQRVLHLGVSPTNVWLDRYQHAHLGDFDSAVRLDDPDLESARPLTNEGYMAPELAAGSKPDERSDLFSLGALLYEIATGTVPSGVLAEDWRAFIPPSALRRDLPSSFDDLVGSLLARDHADRPRSAEQVLEALRQIKDSANIELIIREGESERVEFKATLRNPVALPPALQGEARELAIRQRTPELEKEVALTIAGFMNSFGGTLLIGVDDSGNLLGIESDFPTMSKKDLDGWTIAFRTAVTRHLGAEVWANVRLSLVRREEKTIAVITCMPRSRETWLTNPGGDEEFYVRGATSTERLTPSRAVMYIRERWPAPASVES